jgi:translation initiation factor 2-alpha kinase 1
VKNKLDDNFYAVKKIQLKIKNQKRDINSELERVLREARFLANIFHPNILRYYNCWIELKMYENFETLKMATQPKLLLPPQLPSNSISDSEEFFLEIDSNSQSDFAFEEASFEKATKEEINRFIGPLAEERKKGPEDKKKKEGKKSEIGGKENIYCPQPQKNPILKQLEKKAGNIKPDVFTPPPKTELEEESERIKSIMIYIQSERCDSTLEIYLENRNKEFFQRKNGHNSILKAPFFNEIITIVKQVMAGLTHIHKHCQLVHRDLKPSNIFLHEGLNVKIGDFGLVKKLENLAPMEPCAVFISPSISQEGSPIQHCVEPYIPYNKLNDEINLIR